MNSKNKKKIWIDLDNSPHIPFFVPLIDEFNRRGYELLLTARDAFQVCDLVELFNLKNVRVIGRHYGKNKLAKIFGLFRRSIQLIPLVRSWRPDIALSHGSRSQILLSSFLSLPSVLIMDYEYAKLFPFARLTSVIIPEVVDDKYFKKYSAIVRHYPGLKEDVYKAHFKPDPHFLNKINVKNDTIVVLIRPPATEAHYHNSKSEELFRAVINFLGQPGVTIIVLPRTRAQREYIEKSWPVCCASGQLIIPKRALNGLDLIWHADLVISGGGTMNREAAALQVPVYTIFTGKIGAVDRYLSDLGYLHILRSVEDVQNRIVLERRKKPSVVPTNGDLPVKTIIDHVVSVFKEGV